MKANDLKGLNTAFTEFWDLRAKPRHGHAAWAAVTPELEALSAGRAETLNKQPDPLIEQFKPTNAAFYNDYQTARSIVDSAASHEAKRDNKVTLPASVSAPLDAAEYVSKSFRSPEGTTEN
jgi:hypothetical protein